MKTSKTKIFCLIACCFLLASCSDDSNKNGTDDPINSNDPSNPGTPGSSVVCGSVNCASGQKCVEDKCVTFVEDKAACNETDLICHKGACTDGVCVEVDGACTIEEDCNGGTCIDRRCYLKEGDSCSDSTPDCANSVCYQGKCSTTVPCSGNSECVGYGYCDETAKFCKKYPEIGESCEQTQTCDGGLSCISDLCIQENVVPGGQCDDTLRFCEFGSQCKDGTCKMEVFRGEACDENRICSDPEDVCTDGVCTKTLGGCTKDEECGTDSYCCTEDACETKGRCYPYGTGPRQNINEECVFETVNGQFEASVQCDWHLSASSNDASTALVADTPHDTKGSASIIARMDGHINIWNAETCELLEQIPDKSVGSSSDQISLADLDGDGIIEILSNDHDKVITYKWNPEQKKYTRFWLADGGKGAKAWGGSSIHDINNDGIPEVLHQQFVLDGKTGKCLNPNEKTSGFGGVTIAGDLDLDGKVEAITSNGIVRWNSEKNAWEDAHKFAIAGDTFAFADFGTPGKNKGEFDFTKLDGKTEIVSAGDTVNIYTLEGDLILSIASGKAGAPTIGDFDADKLPEIAIGGTNKYSVFDPRCEKADDTCQGQYTLWTITSQDSDNTVSSSSLFDFDGDGQTEVVYSDECFTRILDGKTGDVLFSSYRMSKIDREYPTISDMDKDEAVEIVLMANSVAPGCDPIDAIHHGVRCQVDADCFSNKCVDGYCRCTKDDECNWQKDSTGHLMEQYKCTAPLAPQKDSDGNVCRAYHRNGDSHQGIVVLRDRLDRWVSSRTIWNQHAFSITNVNDDGSIPKTSEWEQNYTKADKMNNYRKNVEGVRGRNTAPDITGKFTNDGKVCQVANGKTTLNAVVCNRGTKMVARLMPASFYKPNEDGSKTHLCTSYTTANVPIGDCLPVSCEIDESVTGEILLVVNDDGNGGKTTVECNESNNESTIVVTACIN